MPKEGRKTHRVGLWKAIRSGYEAFCSGLSFSVVNGLRTKFW